MQHSWQWLLCFVVFWLISLKDVLGFIQKVPRFYLSLNSRYKTLAPALNSNVSGNIGESFLQDRANPCCSWWSRVYKCRKALTWSEGSSCCDLWFPWRLVVRSAILVLLQCSVAYSPSSARINQMPSRQWRLAAVHPAVPRSGCKFWQNDVRYLLEISPYLYHCLLHVTFFRFSTASVDVVIVVFVIRVLCLVMCPKYFACYNCECHKLSCHSQSL